MSVVDSASFERFPTNPSELGVLMFTNAQRGRLKRGGATADTEALVFLAPQE
jgi:hypothetical protein